jgi:hypothetical protein
MPMTPEALGRVAKLFIDRHQIPLEEAEARLAALRVALTCGPEVFGSPTLQAAVLTAANAASRCFPGGVSLHLPKAGRGQRVRLPWPGRIPLEAAIRQASPRTTTGAEDIPPEADAVLVFGTRPDVGRGLQVTFDGWVAAVAPVHERLRLGERDRCVLAGVLGGALAVSETFLDFAGVAAEATRRRVGLSLWRPDLPWEDEEARAPGVAVEFLPGEVWSLGLGHLGQAYLWALSLLPYREPDRVLLLLQDFDRVVAANLDTGLLTSPDALGRLKTRVAQGFLEPRGFRPVLVERRFDGGTRRYDDEPKLALGGFDGGGPRRALDGAGFERVVDCGLGGTADNFDALDLYTLPCPGRSSADLWPKPGPDDEAVRRERLERLARENPVYQGHARRAGCGHVELAGRSVAVPFVGAVAASFVLAETLRMLHGGEGYSAVHLKLEAPALLTARRLPDGYRGRAVPGIAYRDAAHAG